MLYLILVPYNVTKDGINGSCIAGGSTVFSESGMNGTCMGDGSSKLPKGGMNGLLFNHC